MNTCDTCKWWIETDFERFSFDSKFKARIQEKERTTRECTNPKLSGVSDSHGKLLNQSEACPIASDDTGISFQTGAGFGCIHWEPK